MAFGDNSHLITTATEHDVPLNNTNDFISIGTAEADAYYFDNSGAAKTGDDSLVGFGKNDSILNYKHIFDGNNDGIVDFGPNGILDIDRTSAKAAGADQITIVGMESKQIRSLGTKGGMGIDGAYVYADASVRLKGFTEGTVADNTFDGANGKMKFFYDTALGLNLGGDTINNFVVGDEIITTTKIHNGTDAGAIITFGKNMILDLPGDTDGIHGDKGPVEGGQISFGSSDIHSLVLLSTDTTSGVTYYHYGLAVSA